MNENQIADIIINKAFKIHKKLGPGLLESVYERVLVYELRKSGLNVDQQNYLSIKHDGIEFGNAFQVDVLVEKMVLVEIKSIKDFENIHFKTVLTYLRLSNLKLGILLNFNKELLKDGIKRVINGIIK